MKNLGIVMFKGRIYITYLWNRKSLHGTLDFARKAHNTSTLYTANKHFPTVLTTAGMA